MPVTTSRETSAPAGFDGLRAVVGAGEGVVARFPGLVCVVRCPDPEPVRDFLALCAEVAGPDPGRALARRLATWISGPAAPAPDLRFGTVAAAGDHLAVFLVGAVDARVEDVDGLVLSGAHAALGTDRLLPRPATPILLSLDGVAVHGDPADVHDLRAGVVPGAAVVLHPADLDSEHVADPAASSAPRDGHEWFDTGDARPTPLPGAPFDPPAARVGERNGSTVPASGSAAAADADAAGAGRHSLSDATAVEQESAATAVEQGSPAAPPVPADRTAPAAPPSGSASTAAGGEIGSPAEGTAPTGSATDAATDALGAGDADSILFGPLPAAPPLATTAVEEPRGAQARHADGGPRRADQAVPSEPERDTASATAAESPFAAPEPSSSTTAPPDASTATDEERSPAAERDVDPADPAPRAPATEPPSHRQAGSGWSDPWVSGPAPDPADRTGGTDTGAPRPEDRPVDLFADPTLPDPTLPDSTLPDSTLPDPAVPERSPSPVAAVRVPADRAPRPFPTRQAGPARPTTVGLFSGPPPGAATGVGAEAAPTATTTADRVTHSGRLERRTRERRGRIRLSASAEPGVVLDRPEPRPSGPPVQEEGEPARIVVNDAGSAASRALGPVTALRASSDLTASLPGVLFLPPVDQPAEPPVEAPDEQPASPAAASPAAASPAAASPAAAMVSATAPPDTGRTAPPARIRGYRCENSHLNDPRSPSCRQCGAPIDERVGGLVAGTRPPLGRLVFDNGVAHVVDGGYLVGRMPEADERVQAGELRPIVVEDHGGSVSRVHAEVRVSGWDVIVVDTGSRNGTYVSGAGEDVWTPLPPRRSRRLLPGTRVRMGARMFVFESTSTVR